MTFQMILHISCYGSLDATQDFWIDYRYVGENGGLVMTCQEVKCVFEILGIIFGFGFG